MLRGRPFLVSVSTLMSGTIVAQAITFSTSFVLTRLYDPAEFGHYAIFAGYAGVLAAASTGALDRVVLLAPTERGARRTATAVLLLSLVAATMVAVLGIAIQLAGAIHIVPLTLADLVVFVPLFMVSYAAAQVFTYASLRRDHVRRLSGFKVAQSATVSVVQIVASLTKAIPGLIVGSIVGWMVPMMGGIGWRLSRGNVSRDLRWRSLKAVLRRNWRYPRYVMTNEVIDNLSNQVPLFLIGTLLSLSSVGQYGIALMLLSAPAAVVGQAVGQIFLQYISRVGHDARAVRLTMFRIWAGMGLLGILPFGAVLLFGPTIFGLAFSSQWAEAGQIGQYLSPLLYLRFVSSPTSTIYLKLNLQREQWWFCLAAAVYRTAAYATGAFGVGLETMIAIHVMAEIVAIVLYNVVALVRLRASVARSATQA